MPAQAGIQVLSGFAALIGAGSRTGGRGTFLGREHVGWGERSEPQRNYILDLLGFGYGLNPTYILIQMPHAASRVALHKTLIYKSFGGCPIARSVIMKRASLLEYRSVRSIYC